MLGADRLLLGIADDRRVVNTIGLLPYLHAVPAHERLQHLGRDDAQCVYRGDAHRAQRVIGLLAYHGYLPD